MTNLILQLKEDHCSQGWTSTEYAIVCTFSIDNRLTEELLFSGVQCKALAEAVVTVPYLNNTEARSELHPSASLLTCGGYRELAEEIVADKYVWISNKI